MMPPRSLSPGSQRNSCPGMLIGDRHRRARLSQVLDLLAEDSRLNVYAGELEVRPPGAPTTEGIRRRVSLSEAELQLIRVERPTRAGGLWRPSLRPTGNARCGTRPQVLHCLRTQVVRPRGRRARDTWRRVVAQRPQVRSRHLESAAPRSSSHYGRLRSTRGSVGAVSSSCA